jgi:acetyltransferase
VQGILVTKESTKKKYGTQHVLRNGVSVVFRPIVPADQQRLGEFVAGLSLESLHFRFLEIKKEVPQEMLIRLCNLDFCREIAIVAQPEGEGEIVGVARLTLDGSGRRGEFALVVADAWQGKGLGELMMAFTVEIARDYGLCEMHFFVSIDNYRMMTLAKKLGMQTQSSDGDTVEMNLQL